MTVGRPLRAVLAAVFLAAATACSASSGADASPGTAPSASPAGPDSAGASSPADALPVAATMPDLIGGNAGRAAEQMGSAIEVSYRDASGQKRPVDDPASWKICASRPGPNRQITDFPVVLDVVRVAESCT